MTTRQIGTAVETDMAMPIGGAKVVTIGEAVEVDEAVALQVVVGQLAMIGVRPRSSLRRKLRMRVTISRWTRVIRSTSVLGR